MKKQKQPQLKYPNATWITIRTPIYSRTPSASGLNSPKFRSIAELPTIEQDIDPTTKPLFNHSNTLFSDQEVDMIQYATGSQEIDNCISLKQNHSRLKQIQMAQQELHPEFAIGKSQAKIQIEKDLSDSEKYDEDLDSVISFEDDLNPICFDKDELLTSRSRNINFNQDTHRNEHDDASKREMEEHIWNYCRKSNDPEEIIPNYSSRENNKGVDKKFSPYQMEFYVDEGSNQTMVKKSKTSLGVKKKLDAIALYSAIEKEKRDFVDTKSKLSEKDKLKLESSISAMRYASYMQKNHQKVPDFLDGLDFSSAKMKYMKKKSSLTQPVSPRTSNMHRPLPRL